MQFVWEKAHFSLSTERKTRGLRRDTNKTSQNTLIFHTNIIAQPSKIVKGGNIYTLLSLQLHLPIIFLFFTFKRSRKSRHIFSKKRREQRFFRLVNTIYVILQTFPCELACFRSFSRIFLHFATIQNKDVNSIYPSNLPSSASKSLCNLQKHSQFAQI